MGIREQALRQTRLRRRADCHPWGTADTIARLTSAFDEVIRTDPFAPRVRVHDLSLQNGGPLRGHKSHQSGRDVLAVVGIPAMLFVIVRGSGLLWGARLGARLAGAPDAVVRYAGFGLLPQAGLALALSMLFAKTFPEFGADAGALTLGVVALNELLAPAMYRLALVRSGKAGKLVAAAEPVADPPHTGAQPS